MAFAGRLKPLQQQHKVRLRGLISQSPKSDFVPLLLRLQSPCKSERGRKWRTTGNMADRTAS
jgi:hypothetical protein